MRSIHLSLFCLLLAAMAHATIFGAVRGVVHDPQHRPVQGAMVMLRAKSSDWAKSANTDAEGTFEFNAVPIGEYAVSVASSGFNQTAQNVVVQSDTEPVLHFALSVAGSKETVSVSGAPGEVAPTDSATPITLSAAKRSPEPLAPTAPTAWP